MAGMKSAIFSAGTFMPSLIITDRTSDGRTPKSEGMKVAANSFDFPWYFLEIPAWLGQKTFSKMIVKSKLDNLGFFS